MLLVIENCQLTQFRKDSFFNHFTQNMSLELLKRSEISLNFVNFVSRSGNADEHCAHFRYIYFVL